MAKNNVNPKNITIKGRLSYPVFTMKEALEMNKNSDFPKPEEKVAPQYNILLTQEELDKYIAHIEDHFLPYCEAQHSSKESRDAVDSKGISRIKKVIKTGVDEQDWTDQPPYIPIKQLSEKTQELAPEAVAYVRVFGRTGQDVTLKAIVRDVEDLAQTEEELELLGKDAGKFPRIVPIEESSFEMYPGAEVTATLNMYAYTKPNPGFSASSGTLVFREDAERFGGGGDVIDEDEMFMD